MNKNNLKKFLDITENINEKELSLENCNNEQAKINAKMVKALFDIALDDQVTVYFDGVYVEEPYEGLEFKTLEEEFYYYNNNSYLVFVDDNNFKVKFKIRNLHGYDFDMVYKVTEKACNYTKAHPSVSKYKLY
jgi:hypothetical protein